MSEMSVSDKYARIVQEMGLHPNRKRLSYYLQHCVFHDIDLQGKSMIDIGSGRGIYSFYAGFTGAKRALCIEPELEGSNQTAMSQFKRLSEEFGLPQIELKRVTFQDFDPEDEKFDVILLHHSINHLDEEACMQLKTSEAARKRYRAIFGKLADISNEGSKLVMADCSRYNFFALLKIRNPFAPTIEWQKHQSPYLWCGLLRDFGFTNSRIRWTAPGGLYRLFVGNLVASYFLISHFVMTLTKL